MRMYEPNEWTTKQKDMERNSTIVGMVWTDGGNDKIFLCACDICDIKNILVDSIYWILDTGWSQPK